MREAKSYRAQLLEALNDPNPYVKNASQYAVDHIFGGGFANIAFALIDEHQKKLEKWSGNSDDPETLQLLKDFTLLPNIDKSLTDRSLRFLSIALPAAGAPDRDEFFALLKSRSEWHNQKTLRLAFESLVDTTKQGHETLDIQKSLRQIVQNLGLSQAISTTKSPEEIKTLLEHLSPLAEMSADDLAAIAAMLPSELKVKEATYTAAALNMLSNLEKLPENPVANDLKKRIQTLIEKYTVSNDPEATLDLHIGTGENLMRALSAKAFANRDSEKIRKQIEGTCKVLQSPLQ